MGTQGRRPNAALEQRWRERIERWRSGDRSVAEFCGAEGVSVASFYAWRRRLASRATATGSGPRFVPVRVTAASPAAAVEVVLAGGRVVRVGPEFDAGLLRAVIAAVEAAPC